MISMRSHTPITAYVALGSNLGDRQANLSAALLRIKATEGISVLAVSGSIETPSVGGPKDAPPFLNAAARLEVSIGSHALLHAMLDIEQSLGRVRRDKWEPRLIDLDVLLYGDQIISSQELVVPHPLMHERRFVLQPLAEIAPHVVHPVLQMSIAGLLENLSSGV